VDSKYGSLWVWLCSNKVHGLYGWGYKKISGRVGRNSLAMPNLRREMDLELDYGMTSGAEIKPLRKLSRISMYCLS